MQNNSLNSEKHDQNIYSALHPLPQEILPRAATTNTGQFRDDLSSPRIRTPKENVAGCSQAEQALRAWVKLKAPKRGDFESTTQFPTELIDAGQQASSRGVHVIEDISMGNDGQQILVFTTGELVEAKRVTAGSRVVQFVGLPGGLPTKHLWLYAIGINEIAAEGGLLSMVRGTRSATAKVGLGQLIDCAFGSLRNVCGSTSRPGQNGVHESRNGSLTSHDQYTIAWICALHIEMAAARAMLDEVHQDLPRHRNDSNTYTLGSIEYHNIVIACLPTAQYGTNNAANVLTHLVRTFPSIRLGLMVGIGGGVPSKADIRLGDIVVGTRVMQYDLGKIVGDGQTQLTAIPKIPQQLLGTVVSTLRSKHELEPSRVPSILREKFEGHSEYGRPSSPDCLFCATYDHISPTPGCDGCDHSKLILSNPVTEARDNRKGIAYVLSRMEWYWNLVPLLLDENKAEYSSAGLRVQLEKHVLQLYEKLLSYQMKSACLYHRNWAAVIGRDMVKIDDWAGQLIEIQEAEAAMQLWKLTDAANAIEMNLQDIHSAIQDQIRQQEKRHQDDRDKQCLTDLRETDPRDDKTRIQGTKGGLLRDSYRWILDHDDFQRWRNDPQSQLLWIKGDPGKGKTMLLCGIIDEPQQEPDKRLSYFFCQATEARLSNATAVLRGLIYLLVVQQPSLACSGEARPCGLDDAILIVDALDECTTNRLQLLDFITKPTRIKWIVSSRNWLDIEERLDNAEQRPSTRALDTRKQLARDKRYNEETRHAVENHFTSNADGTFLWVALVCQKLALPKARARNASSTVKEFPPGLNPLYMRMMEYIHDLEGKDSDRCKKTLAAASLVYRPVDLEELRVLAKSVEDLSDNDLEEIIALCGSFLTLRQGVVYFVHQSAKDFLLENATEQILPFGIANQHHALFSRSLGALSETLRRDIYNLSAPGFPIDQISPPDPNPLASVRYSCIYWVNHLDNSEPEGKMSGNGLQDGGIIHDFFKSKYLHWLESLSLLRSTSEGVLAVQKLKALVRHTKAQELTELLRDARRFILSHKRAIEIAPLQIYTLALMFSPTCSLIRELFRKEEPNWITLKPSVELDWNACLQTLEGHDNSVMSMAFSADGQRLASGSWDNTVKVWDAATGACVQTLEGHDHWVMSVAFSADGQRLASGSHDNTVKVWDAATGAYVQTLEGHGDVVRSVAFSADGQWLASGSGDKTVKVWDAATGACVQTLEIDRVITHLSFDPMTNSLLSTDIGLLNLDLPALRPAIDDQSIDATLRSDRHSGWGISTDGLWIVKDGKGMLWLPPEYRGSESAVVGSTVAIGCRSGRILVMKFS
ncbi:hypothetical protein BGZ61DRAFT_523576 [Ilyonectria robusta]|uniref:uncharacterized protein n=1 Tax=Ilyonectria robusta TaxID=1079257 RepID=UPI001E8CF9A1|nr:uncharacterized protein BGZ61DRAFT_523576 [Ilyonectria robusta]KAH8659477.1 hypothetical protein BGZ61DRAFT_523576 [Ilyonectria robusta]